MQSNGQRRIRFEAARSRLYDARLPWPEPRGILRSLIPLACVLILRPPHAGAESLNLGFVRSASGTFTTFESSREYRNFRQRAH